MLIPSTNTITVLAHNMVRQTTVSYAVSGQLYLAYSQEYWLEANTRQLPTFMVRSDQRSCLIDRLFDRSLQTPIPVVIECEQDSRFVAEIPDLNMAMSGDSVGDALAALKEYVEMSIESFREERDDLGPEPTRQLEALEAYIGKGPGSQFQT